MKPDPDFKKAYHLLYDQANYGSSLAGRFMRQSHRILESDFRETDSFDRVIEVGAGTGQHINFVRHRFGQYHMTDMHDDMLKQAMAKLPADLQRRVVIGTQDATCLKVADHSFDRLIATHVLEHLHNPQSVLREWNRVVRPGGVISIVLPCDPGMMWRFGRQLGPRRNAVRRGIEYDYLQAAEHVNSIFNLVTFIKYYFSSIKEVWYPARVSMPDLNLFYICNITN